MKVLWLAPFPYLIDSQRKGYAHPAPWLVALAQKVALSLDLTVCVPTHKVRIREEWLQDQKVNIVYLRTPHPVIDILTFFIIKIVIIKNWIKKNQHNYDCIHIHGTEHQYASALFDIKLPKIISIQGLISQCFKYQPKLSFNYIQWRLGACFEKKEIMRNKYFFCRTDWDKSNVKKINDQALIFHNWEVLRDAFFERNYRYESDRLIFLGGGSYLKGIVEVIKVVNQLHVLGHQFNLIICGATKMFVLNRIIKKYGGNIPFGAIQFMGIIDARKLTGVFADSFCLLHLSYIDNSPNSVCEAQASGLPVIATNVGGVSSLIENYKNGLLVERYDVDAVVQKIQELKSNRRLYEKISTESRALAKQRHDPQQIVSNVISAYETVIGRNNYD